VDAYFGDFRFGNLIFQRCLAAVYLIAFISALNQFPALLGEKGFLPVSDFIRRVPFEDTPSLFYLGYSDRLFTYVAWIGIILSSLIFLGLFERVPWWLLTAAWLVLWFLYLSIVNVGQIFYAFGWESMLLEAGFFAAFLGPATQNPSLIPVLAVRWMLFRLILGAGLIKLRNDPCWRDLTCLFYHYETQPIPNPLSWYFHHLPKIPLMIGVFFNHFVEVAAPFGLLGPQWVAAAAGMIIISHQLVLIVGGNYAWLNMLTIVLGITAFSDGVIGRLLPGPAISMPAVQPRPESYHTILMMLALVTVVLSVRPALNLCSREQRMNYSYNPIHLINDYGVFGTITKERYEIVIEGTGDATLTPKTKWKEYEFKGKPGDVRRMPPQIAPYHLRLDWLMWFLPFSVEVTENGILMAGHELWFLRFMEKLLEADRKTLKLLRTDPFSGKPPHYLRARYYLYQFTNWKEKKATGAWWKRKLIDEYLPPVTLAGLRKALDFPEKPYKEGV
jgi:hypothetical protein